jgi:hypothetical protein
MDSIPSYWKTDLSTVDELARTEKRGQVGRIATSPGGRPVYTFSYGEKGTIQSQANYNSACGAKDRRAYVDIRGKKPVILLIGAEHGQETEGVAALTNLICLMETGADFAGNGNPSLLEVLEQVRLDIVPVANPDGRARVQLDSMLGHTGDELRFWGQGTWKDGTLCRWPDCKKVHPILDAVDFLGGYFNDDGINIMHDQFFHPMARETEAILDLAVDEFADCVLHLHGGSNSFNVLLQPDYVPLEVNYAVQRLALRCDAAAQQEELRFGICDIPAKEQGDTPPSFNLVSAVHHACGAVSAVFESNECIIDDPGVHLNHDQVYRSHMILFEQTVRHFLQNIRG